MAREIPILFSAAMVRAIIAGRKTVTRRRIKEGHCPDGIHPKAGPYLVRGYTGGGAEMCQHFPMETLLAHCQYGGPGTILWVRETWRAGIEWDDTKPSDIDPLVCSDVWYEADGDGGRADSGWGRVRQSIFMPRWASRITLEVRNVKVERLYDITEEEAIAEGVGASRINFGQAGMETHRSAFVNLWKDINGVESWESNPWVFCVEFRRL